MKKLTALAVLLGGCVLLSACGSGAVIPGKTIVASNSLVGKDMSAIPPESIIGGVPAKLITTGRRKVESGRFNAVLHKYFVDNPASECYIMPKGADHSICDVD